MKNLAFIALAILAGLWLWAEESPVNISNTQRPSDDVHLAVNQDGEVGAVWIEKTYEDAGWIYYSIYKDGHWSQSAALPGQSGTGKHPHIARGRDNGFVFVWHDVGYEQIRYVEYTNGTWSSAVQVSQTGGFDLGFPKVTTTPNRRTIVAWQRGDPVNQEIYVRTFNNGWGGISNISNTGGARPSRDCDINCGPDSKVYVVWHEGLENEPYPIEIMMAEENGSGQWSPSFLITRLNEWQFKPAVAATATTVMATHYWFQNMSYYGTARISGQWEESTQLGDIGLHQEHNWYISDITAFGQGFLIVFRNVGNNISYVLWGNKKFSTTRNLTSNGGTWHPAVAFDAKTGAVAAWTDRSGDHDIYALFFTPKGDPGINQPYPPSNVRTEYKKIEYFPADLAIQKVINRNLFSVRYLNHITWSKNPDWEQYNIDVLNYRIYRKTPGETDWELLQEVSSSTFSYSDGDQVTADSVHEYRVVGVDELGLEFYRYDQILWEKNPENESHQIVIKNYRVYRKLESQSENQFALISTTDPNVFTLEQHSAEIRRGVTYDYAVSALDDKEVESDWIPAVKISADTHLPPREKMDHRHQ